MMKFINLINKKKLNQELNQEEIDYIVENYSNNFISDEQMTKLIDGFMKNGMSEKETMDFFDSTYKRARIIDLSNIKDFKIDKHATGGVGDKVSLILMPILDALNVKIFKLTGGRLGHTGGTTEKLSSFTNMKLKISPERFEALAQKNNALISYAHDEISVFEKKLYHLRNISKKVGVLGMIVNSIMIKKMVLNNDGLIINLKIGTGTVFKTIKEGLAFTQMASKIAQRYKRKISFVFSDMNQPLGINIGNKIEVLEAIDYLEGRLYHLTDLNEIINAHVHEALLMNGKSNGLDQTNKMIRKVINSGQALNCFRNLVTRQNGDFDSIYQNRTIKTLNKIEIYSWKNGYFDIPDNSKIGTLANEINLDQGVVNYEAGIQIWKKKGDLVKKNELVATIWTNHNNINDIQNRFKTYIEISDQKVAPEKQIKKIIRHF